MASENVIPTGGLATSSNPLAGSRGQYVLENMVADMPGWATKRNGMKQLGVGFIRPTSWTSVFSLSSTYAIVSSWTHDDHLFIYVEDGTNSGIAAYSLVTSAGWHKVVEQASIIRLDKDQYKLKQYQFDRRSLVQTSTGVKRIAAIYDNFYPKGSTTSVNYSTMYRNAGIPRALDPRCPNAVAGGASLPGLIALTGFEWLLLSSAVAYRIVWIKRDENAILGVGAPSGRVVVRNTSSTTNYATRLKVPIPAGCNDTSYVMQVYRTNIIQINGSGVIPDPGDEMFLAGEYRLTSNDLSNQYVLYEDVSFDGLIQDALYTNQTQEGPLAGRLQPPICRDLASYGGCAFFANTTERNRLTMKILAVDSSGIGTFKGVRVGDMIVAGDLVMEGVAPANEETQTWYFAVDQTTGAGSEVYRATKTAESFCYKYNLWSNARNGRYYAYNLTTNNDIVGVVGFEEKSIGGDTGAYIGVSRVDAPVQILPAPVFTSTPSNTLAQACAVVTDVGPTTVTVTTAAAHSLTTNDLVFLAPFATSTESGTSSPRFANTDVPAGLYKVTVTGATTFTFPSPSGAASNQTDARAATTGGYVHKVFDTTSSIWTEARSDNSRRPNRLMWSSFQEPECAPLLNTVDLGSASKAILRIVPTQDSLFIFKEDGLWRLKGEAGDWEIIVLDAACILAGAETPGIVDGRIFTYTSAGVVAVDDGGTQKVSGSVSGDLENMFRSLALDPTISQTFVGCGHNESKSYWLSCRTGGTTAGVYRYHIPTRTWSKHYFTFPTDTQESRSGVAFITTAKASRYTSADSQAYSERLVVCSTSTNSSKNMVLIERRTGLVIDYSDCEIGVTVNSFDTSANTATLASASGLEVGDVLIWYLTGSPGVTPYVPAGYSFSVSSANGGKYRAKITAINSNTVTLDISGNVPALSTWPTVASGTHTGAVVKQIRATISPVPITKDGLTLLRFNEIIAGFGSCGRFTKCDFGFNTETATATPGTYQATSSVNGFAYADWLLFGNNMADTTLQYLRTFRTGIPRSCAVGSYLIPSLRNSAACENFDVAGIRVMYEEADNKTRKTNA